MGNFYIKKGFVFGIIIFIVGANLLPSISGNTKKIKNNTYSKNYEMVSPLDEPDWVWANQINGSVSLAYSVAMDQYGNSYVTGLFGGTVCFGDITLISSGYVDVFIAKLDGSGNWLWAKQGGGADYDLSYDICVDSDGNSFITGLFWETATFGSTILSVGNDHRDFFVAKLDGSGNWLWAKNIGISGFWLNEGLGIDIDAGGDVIVTGRFTGTVSFGGIILTCYGGDIFVAKMDNDGNWLWAQQGGANSQVYCYDISIDSIGNSYIVGTFWGSISFDGINLESSGWDDIFVAKLDKDGVWQWAKRGEVPGTSDRRFLVDEISTDFNGNSYIVGNFKENITFGDITLTSSNYSVFIAKIDKNGNWQWAKQGDIGFEDFHLLHKDERECSIVVDSVGNIYVTGYFYGTAIFDDIILIHPILDIFVVKLDEYGNWLWGKNTESTSYSWILCCGINIDSFNCIYVTGYFTGTPKFGDTTLYSLYDVNTFIAKLTQGGGYIDINVDSINGGFRFSADIQNSGNVTAYDISWSIDLNGGLIFIGDNSYGTIDVLDPGEETTVRQKSLFGIGHNVEITVTAGGSSKKAIASWILGPLVLGLTDIS
jgi:hypothetical protein